MSLPIWPAFSAAGVGNWGRRPSDPDRRDRKEYKRQEEEANNPVDCKGSHVGGLHSFQYPQWHNNEVPGGHCTCVYSFLRVPCTNWPWRQCRRRRRLRITTRPRKDYSMTGGPDRQPPRHRLAPGRISLKLALKRGGGSNMSHNYISRLARPGGLGCRLNPLAHRLRGAHPPGHLRKSEPPLHLGEGSTDRLV